MIKRLDEWAQYKDIFRGRGRWAVVGGGGTSQCTGDIKPAMKLLFL